MLQVKKYDSILKINSLHWDSLLNNEDVFHSYGFIRIVEESKVENARFHYLMYYDNELLVSTAVLTAFDISLDVFIGKTWLVRKLKRLIPGLFKIRILTCGLPASFGQLNLKIINEKYVNEICPLLCEEMHAVAKQSGIKFMTIKEFTMVDMKRYKQFTKQGFFLANSLPYMTLPVRWRSFSNYLDSMRHHYRRKVLMSLKKIKCKWPAILSLDEYKVQNPSHALVLSDTDPEFADQFYRMYLKVMDRTTAKLETLNPAFFEHLFSVPGRYKLLSLMINGKMISSAVLIFSGDVLFFMLVARDNEKDEYDSYFNIVYGIIALAIREGFKKIKLGQTCYWLKQCVGGMPENEFFYFASTGKISHFILKRARHLLFPLTRLENIRVFKTGSEQTKELLIPVETYF